MAAVACLMACLSAGCQPKREALDSDRRRALELRREGLEAEDPATAAELFAEAVRLDPYSGEAHNNLGVALLRRDEYHAAARSLDQAIRLLPSSPAPRLNLGLLYESVGQLQKAAEQYEQALILGPGYLPAAQALARARVRLGLVDRRTLELLRDVSERADDESWRRWAQLQLFKAEHLAVPPGAVPTTGPTRPAPAERDPTEPP